MMPDLRKVPVWYYGAAAAGAGVLFFLYRRRKASQAAAATTAAGVGTASAAGTQAGTYNANDISTLLDQLQGAPSQPIVSDYTPPIGEKVQGLGYQPTQGLSSVVGVGNNTFSQIANAPARNALIAAGQTVYYQPAPGIFMPYNPATMNKTHTPTFVAA